MMVPFQIFTKIMRHNPYAMRLQRRPSQNRLQTPITPIQNAYQGHTIASIWPIYSKSWPSFTTGSKPITNASSWYSKAATPRAKVAQSNVCAKTCHHGRHLLSRFQNQQSAKQVSGIFSAM